MPSVSGRRWPLERRQPKRVIGRPEFAERRDSEFPPGDRRIYEWRATLLRREEPTPNGVPDQIGVALEIEFPHKVGPMAFNRADANA
jgi:hypothetical protein